MTDTGSALLDEIRAKRRELDKVFRRPYTVSSSMPVHLTPVKPQPPVRPVRLPMVRMEPQKSVALRIAEVKKLRGTIPELELQTILNAIYGSARDCGDNSLDQIAPETTPEKVIPGVPSITSIKHLVADHFSLTIDEMLSYRRRRGIVIARQIAMYIIRDVTHKSYEEISMRFGGRDHTTVIHAIHKITRLIAEDQLFAEEIVALKRMVTG